MNYVRIGIEVGRLDLVAHALILSAATILSESELRGEDSKPSAAARTAGKPRKSRKTRRAAPGRTVRGKERHHG